MQIGMQTYKAALVKVYLGRFNISGFGEDTFIEVEYNSDAFETNVGAQGDVSRSQNADDTIKVVLTLKGESLSNDVLSGIAAVDRLLATEVYPLLIKDGSGTTLVSAGECWIKKPASIGFGKKREHCKWELVGAHTYVKVGGTMPVVRD